jgi:hypothetical protein
MSHDTKRPVAIPFETLKVSRDTPALTELEFPYSINTLFFNGLNVPVTIVHRNGLSTTIPRRLPGGGKGGLHFPRKLLIRQTYRLSRDVILDPLRLFDESEFHWDESCKVVDRALNDPDRKYNQSNAPINVDFSIEAEDFTANCNSMYLTQLDLVVSTLQGDYAPYHPFSRLGTRDIILQNDPAVVSPENFSYGIRLVDKQNRFGRQFMNIAGEVFAIRPITKSEMADGVYLSGCGAVSDSGLSSAPRCTYLTFEQAREKLGLYHTVEEAATRGNPKAVDDRLKQAYDREVLQSKINERERQEALEILKHEEAMAESRRKAAQIKLDEELAAEKHRRDMEALARKEEYEQKSHERRNWGELLKYAPIVMSGIGSMLLVLAKRK